MNLLYAIIASIIVSLISLIGVFALVIKDNLLKRLMVFLVAFAAGGLIGGAFFDIIPEASEYVKDITQLFFYIVLGYTLFFILEKYLHWRHCHSPECKIHRLTYLNIIGDIVHNFSDGLILGAIFLLNINFLFSALAMHSSVRSSTVGPSPPLKITILDSPRAFLIEEMITSGLSGISRCLEVFMPIEVNLFEIKPAFVFAMWPSIISLPMHII